MFMDPIVHRTGESSDPACADERASSVLALTLAVLFFFGSCNARSPDVPPRTEGKEAVPPGARPTASEVFRLRSECAKLGDKLRDENTIGPALTQDVVTKYNPETNRCYALLTIQNIEKSEDVGRYLYDGQTRELLAFTKFALEHPVGS